MTLSLLLSLGLLGIVATGSGNPKLSSFGAKVIVVFILLGVIYLIRSLH